MTVAFGLHSSAASSVRYCFAMLVEIGHAIIASRKPLTTSTREAPGCGGRPSIEETRS